MYLSLTVGVGELCLDRRSEAEQIQLVLQLFYLYLYRVAKLFYGVVLSCNRCSTLVQSAQHENGVRDIREV